MKLINPVMISIMLWPTGAAAQPASADDAILSAFFGLNDSRQIRLRTLPVCGGIRANGLRSRGGDGMPVIFSHEVDPETLDADDFAITTSAGITRNAECVTLRPADDPGELRTALVIGEYGSLEDPPVRVEITGEVLSLDGRINFQGASSSIIPLDAGPTLILAETVPEALWQLGEEDECPLNETVSIVRATWVGGITKPGGSEIDTEEMQLYRVTLQQADGSTTRVTPIAVGDLNDNDNNHDLCIGFAGDALSVSFPAGALTDPNEDLNPDTQISVRPGRAE